MYGIGIMSGTSLDGLDIVIIDCKKYLEQKEIFVVAADMYNYDSDFRQQLRDLCHENTASLSSITMMNAYLGKFIGECVNHLISKSKLDKEQIAFISSHGQTIYHEPVGGTAFFEIPATLQIGDISYISEVTKLPVIGDFRTGDMAAGGQGAPLLSYFDAVLLQHEKFGRAIQNIGGIGNVTYLPAGNNTSYVSFDTGPGNVLIDSAVQILTNGKQTYDKDGAIARQGTIHKHFITKWMKLPYYKQPLPKTTGRELYTIHYVEQLLTDMNGLSVEDQIATITAYTVETIRHSYGHYLSIEELDEIYINGGGSCNPFLMELLAQAFPSKKVYTLDELGVPSIWKEAIGFAIFGLHTMLGKPNQLPAATGAKREVVMGKVSYCDGNAWERFSRLRGE